MEGKVPPAPPARGDQEVARLGENVSLAPRSFSPSGTRSGMPSEGIDVCERSKPARLPPRRASMTTRGIYELSTKVVSFLKANTSGADVEPVVRSVKAKLIPTRPALY